MIKNAIAPKKVFVSIEAKILKNRAIKINSFLLTTSAKIEATTAATPI